MQIVYFHKDLRLNDNAALWHACDQGPIIPLYIWDEKAMGQWKYGPAQRWWLQESLKHLQKQLKKHGLTLIFRRGDTLKILKELVKQTDATGICYNRCYDGTCPNLEDLGIEVHHFPGALLAEPWEISPAKGGYFKVFTPFWKTCLKELEPPTPLPVPQLRPYQHKIVSDDIDNWNLGTGSWKNYWQPGEESALKRLKEFASHSLGNYAIGRDFPAKFLTSRLSPHLAFGEITPGQIWHAAKNECFLREIGWREFCHHLLYHFPDLPVKPFDQRFEAFKWKHDSGNLKRWQEGITGYPIVDAGMRELLETGWMHNRVRMIVASFLTKDLLIPWQRGAEWFWEKLVDADLANNSANWQWVAGCGADAAPFFRIFNPALQAEKFDAESEYIHRWVPELKNDPKNYPKPIVDHKDARNTALKHFADIKNRN